MTEMASKLQTILDAVQATITESVSATHYRTGHRFITERQPGPRIVWVPGKDEYSAPRAAQGRDRSVRTRSAQVLAHVFADDLESAETLVHAVVYAAHKQTHGAYNVDSGDWFAPEWLDKGEGCVVKLSFDIPVTAPSLPIVTPNAGFDTTGSVAGDGNLDAGES
jgi:hypothetical protein